ncbi:TPA: Lrp/AsnC family transcriptional regulator [Legionella pneumophila]|nr:Lrp/AsnC family transcriptional regulator [Legionella pneumophila]HDV5695172.1 Lrp/AsnC family transcriptional regulator [Legionella pneumophila]HDV5796879.1 Lrp/AsnC family transcriptional regulator [Legionella pneumophila]
MDRIDKKILEVLQADGRVSNQELAEQVALSPSPCLRRVKQLEEDGYIRGYVALLDPAKIGLQLTVMVSVALTNHDSKVMKHFEETVASFPEVIQCYLITGQSADYIIKVVVSNLDEYQVFLLKKLTIIDGVNQVHSSFVLQRIVDITSLPLKHLNEQSGN